MTSSGLRFRFRSTGEILEKTEKRQGTSYYADISGQTTSNGTDVVQYEFTGDNSQRWSFEYFGDQYYCIVSANSLTNYYLGVENDSIINDAQIEIRTGTVTDGMKWKIETTSSGAYKLIPKSGELYSKAIAVKNDAVEGSPVLQRLYSYDTNYRDEWEIFLIEKSYINYYDSSLQGDSLLSYIDDANNLSINVYKNICHIGLSINGTPTRYYNAIADQCTRGQNEECTESVCGSDCRFHHKNVINISDQLYYDGISSNNSIKVLWTNRAQYTYCHNNGESHSLVGWIAVVCDYRPVIQFLNIRGTTLSKKQACMALVLVHETAHTFGMPDVYNNPGHDDSSAYLCVMEKFQSDYAEAYYETLLDHPELAFCHSCTIAIKSFVYD